MAINNPLIQPHLLNVSLQNDRHRQVLLCEWIFRALDRSPPSNYIIHQGPCILAAKHNKHDDFNAIKKAYIFINFVHDKSSF